MGRTSFVVTGGLGFIGSAYVRALVQAGERPLVVDSKTYAGDERRLTEVDGRYDLEIKDVTDPSIGSLIQAHQPSYIVHFAAESHVTRGEKAAQKFWRTNVLGTENLLRAAEHVPLNAFLHVSTDEIYGPCFGRPFSEEDKHPGTDQATSSYAKSKSQADDLALSFRNRVPILVLRPTNCFGSWQHPEKAVARWITRAIQGEQLPVWGSGEQRRSWLYVDDVCEAVSILLERGVPGSAYNVGPDTEPPTNLEVAQSIAEMAGHPENVYLTAYDRPDHDIRYALASNKLRGLGWKPRSSFRDALARTFGWYRENESWWVTLVDHAEEIYGDSAKRSGSAAEGVTH